MSPFFDQDRFTLEDGRLYTAFEHKCSTHRSQKICINYTTHLGNRLAVHNSGKSHHTSKYCPWSIETVIRFRSRTPALAFERYLKSHSGKAFASKRLQQTKPAGRANNADLNH